MIAKLLKTVLVLLLSFVIVKPVYGSKRYWVGNGSNLNWNSTANWSTSSGGSSGASVPGSSDTAYFDGGALGKCVLDVNIDVKRFEIQSGYTDSLIQNNKTITIGTSGFRQSGGKFFGDSTAITISGSYSMTAGYFRSTKSTLTCSSDFTADVNTGTFAHNNGKVLLDNTSTITGPGTIFFYQLELKGQSTQKTFTIVSGSVAVVVVNDFTQSGTGGVVINTGYVYARGDIYLNTNSTGGGGTATIHIDGTGDQSLNGGSALLTSGRIQHVIINKTSGSLYLYNYINVIGNFTHTAGTVVPGTSTVNFYTTKTITGSITLYNVAICNGTAATTITIASSTTITATNNLEYNGQTGSGWYIVTNGGTIAAQGNITDNNTAGGGGGSTTILINGTGSQTLTGSGSNSEHFLPSVNIYKTSGTLYLASKIPVAGNWTYTAGTIDPGTSEVVFAWGKTVSGTHTLYSIGFYYTGTTITVNLASGTILTVNGTYTHYGFNPSALTVNTGTIEVKGNINLASANGHGGGTVLMKICGTGDQTITGNSSGMGFLPNVEINKPSGTLYFVSMISSGGNSWTHTAGAINAGSSTLQIVNGPNITGSMTLNNLTFYAGNNATATLGSSTQLTVANLSFTGTTHTTGTTLNSGTITVSGNITHQRLQYGGGTTNVILNGSSNQTIYGRGTVNSYKAWLPNLIINKSGGNVTADSSVIVKGRLTLKGSSNYQINGSNGGELWVGGDSITLGGSSTANGGSALIKIDGASVAQRLSGSGSGLLPKVKIDKTGSNALTISGTVNVGNDWTYTAGTLTVTGSTVSFDKSLTITGTHTLNNVTFAPTSSSTVGIASGTTLTVPSILTFGGTSGLTVNTGTIAVTGSITVTNTVATGGGSATINVNGSGSQTIAGTSGSSAVPLCNVNISKSSGILDITGNSLSFGGSLTCTTGTTSVSSSNTAYFYETAGLTASAIPFKHVTIVKGMRRLFADLNVVGDLTIQSVNTPTLEAASGNYHINLQGNWNNASKFISGTGFVKFIGTNDQTITQPVTDVDSIAKIQINKSGGTLTLSSQLNLTDSLKFTSGKLTTSTSNLLILKKRSAVSGMSSTSFVSGPVRKVGNTAFTFPTGKASNYQPVSISAPTNSSDAFTAEYFNAGQTLGTVLDTVLDTLSTCEYWDLNQSVGTSSVTSTIGWNSNSCNYFDTLVNMRVVGWDGAKWIDIGGDNITGNATSGTVTSEAKQSFGPITIGHNFYCILLNPVAHAGPDRSTISGGKVTIGANPILTGNLPVNLNAAVANWNPQTFLSALNTSFKGSALCTPTSTTTYTVSIKYAGCKVSDATKVSISAVEPAVFLKRQLDGGFYDVTLQRNSANNSYLFFKYDEEYTSNGNNLTYNIYDNQQNLLTSLPTLAVSYKDNRYSMDLTTLSGLSSPNSFYVLEVVDKKGDKFYLRFKY